MLERAQAALHRYGTGCTGSRFLNGTLDMHEELEARLAKLMGQEACLVFSTGYQTNLGIIATLAGRGSVVLQDRLNHASLVDGSVLSAGELMRYPHGDLAALRRILERSWDAQRRRPASSPTAIFSMEGDIVDLPSIVALAREYGARVMVDDAHARRRPRRGRRRHGAALPAWRATSTW